MKKAFCFLTALTLILFGVSCTKNNGNRPDGGGNNQEQQDPNGNGGEDPNGNGGEDPNGEDPNGGNQEPEGPRVKTCDENLVLWISFDTDNLIEKGEGVTFKENKGDAQIKTGFIGKGWTNKSGVNKTQAYSKFDVAAGSVFSKLDKVTMTAWVKETTTMDNENYKGGLFSLNGGLLTNGNPHDFPAMCVYFDNTGVVDLEDGTQEATQQVNGRFIFHDNNGVEQNLWLDTWHSAFAIYGEWFHFAVTYDKDAMVKDEDSGQMVAMDQVNLYVNGMQVAARTFDQKIPFNNLVTDATNAFYVGGWSTFIEGHSTQTWQSFWPGSLDEIRFYDKALSAEEILALYKEELAINLEQE